MGNKMINDSLGDRMKDQYENRTRFMLPRRTYTIIRVDGKSFHTFTSKLKRPYDEGFMQWMDAAALALCEEIQGAQFAFIQSDEISVLFTDFAKIETCAAFDGNLQKLCSVSASVASVAFNSAIAKMLTLPRFNIRRDNFAEVDLSAGGRIAFNGEMPSPTVIYNVKPDALFDSRVFTIPDPVEVANYFIWRQKDAERNSVSMLAQSYASQKELHGKDRAAQHELIHSKGDNWNNHPSGFKRGRCIVSVQEEFIYEDQVCNRSAWKVSDVPVFTEQRDFLDSRIPRYESEVVNAR